MLKAIASLLSIISTALGWARDESLKGDGENRNAVRGLTETVKVDEAARRLDDRDSGLTDAELDRRLHRSDSR